MKILLQFQALVEVESCLDRIPECQHNSTIMSKKLNFLFYFNKVIGYAYIIATAVCTCWFHHVCMECELTTWCCGFLLSTIYFWIKLYIRWKNKKINEQTSKLIKPASNVLTPARLIVSCSSDIFAWAFQKQTIGKISISLLGQELISKGAFSSI